MFIFLSPLFTASSECQAHGVCQHANAVGDDVEATLVCLRHWRPPIWPEPSQSPHSLQCSDMLSFMLSLRDPSPRQTSTSCLQIIRVVQMGRDHLDQPSPELGTFFSCYQLKLENPNSRSTLPHQCIASLGKRNQSLSLLGAAWFLNIWYTQQMGSTSWYVPKICNKKKIVQFLQGATCDSET